MIFKVILQARRIQVIIRSYKQKCKCFLLGDTNYQSCVQGKFFIDC
jgi:hypothetical protein